MEKGILITLPKSDDVTEYLSVFSEDIIINCQKKQIPIRLLRNKGVTKSNVEIMLKKLNYKMVIFNGHGSPNNIKGHKNEEIICVNKNDYLLKGRITYSRSCWSITGLGEKCVKRDKNGCFIGYKIPFMFIIDKTRITNPIKDKIAKVFFDTSNLVPIGLIKGHNTKESNDNSKRSMLKAINKALKKGDKDSEAIAETLWNNYVGQEILGNHEAKL